jgi:uncharacterized membrane protein YraQ (UPF0718 family)
MEPDNATVAVPAAVRPSRPIDRAVLCGVAAFVVVAGAALTYAKWWPYAGKVSGVVSSHTYSSASILADAGAPGASPSWHDAWSFTTSYGLDVWIGLAAAVLIGAGVEVLVPRRWLRRTLDRKTGMRSAWRGGLLAVPCLMCTCCASPITISLRRSKVPVAGSLAYWLGNPLLNPVVLIILAVVLPWPYVVGRIVIGALIVFGAAPLVARFTGARSADAGMLPQDPHGPPTGDPPTGDTSTLPPTIGRYARAVLRLAAVILPVYFLVVLAVGAFRGWLLPIGHGGAHWGTGTVVAAVAVAAVGGTLLVVPTAAEVPVIFGLLALGVPVVVAGVLLVALPAISLPSMAMVGRSLSWRTTATAGVAVVLCALAAGGLVAAL